MTHAIKTLSLIFSPVLDKDKKMGSLWLMGAFYNVRCLGVATILQFETIEIAWPTND